MELETLVRLVRRQEGAVKAWLVLIEEQGVILSHSGGIFGGALVGRFLEHVYVVGGGIFAFPLSLLETSKIVLALLAGDETSSIAAMMRAISSRLGG